MSIYYSTVQVCIKWEERRVADEKAGIVPPTIETRMKGRTLLDQYRPAVHADTVVYFLVRLPCQVHETSTAAAINNTAPPPASNAPTPGEQLSRRCSQLLKRALVVWPTADPKLGWLDKLFQGLESPHVSLGNICSGLELLNFLITKLKKEQMLGAVKSNMRGILCCVVCPNNRVIRLLNTLIVSIYTIFGVEELEDFSTRASKIIQDTLCVFDRVTSAGVLGLYPALMVLRSITQFTKPATDKIMNSVMKVLQRITRDHISPAQAAPDITRKYILIICLLLPSLTSTF